MNIFEPFIIDNEIYVDAINWNYIKSSYSKEFIIKEISDVIDKHKIHLPYRKYSYEDMKNDFISLMKLNTGSLLKTGNWNTKFHYNYSKLNQYIDITNIGNVSSDFFHQDERWKCDATGYPSPDKTWKNEKYRLTLFKALFSLNVEKINPAILRNIISLRKYIAAQFRPSVAKTIYDMFKAESVLDFSMGWGDRIAGAYASEVVKKYVGIDPASCLFNGYQSQLNAYSKINPVKKEFILYCDCAENENLIINDEFDLIFTSPPYFDKEKYDQSERQSYKKYKTFDSWMQNFLFKTIELRCQNLRCGGYFVINISDIYTRHKLYKICDKMNDYIASTNKFEYIGAIGLRMPKRPKSISFKINGIFAEPIWVWKKIR